MSVHSILVVEDDVNLRLALVDNLEIEGYQVVSVGSIAEAEQALKAATFDLCVLDIMLPDGDGYSFCRACRTRELGMLILMLTARVLEGDMDAGFDVGADDYMRKPYRLQELLLRIRALLRRSHTMTHGDVVATINGFDVDWAGRMIRRDGADVFLTKKEFDLLVFLFQNIGSVQSRDVILDAVWGLSVHVDTRTVDNFISRLKKLLDLSSDNEFYIRSVRGGWDIVWRGPLKRAGE